MVSADKSTTRPEGLYKITEEQFDPMALSHITLNTEDIEHGIELHGLTGTFSQRGA